MSARVLILLLLLGAGIAEAQDPRLATRFSAEHGAALEAIVDSARAAQLPTEPLVQRALEGVSRQVPPPRIVAAVRALATRLRDARRLLGPEASEPELVAGASALFVGVEPQVLERLARSRGRAGTALPLIVLVDIVERGVPRDTAERVILSISDPRVPDADFQTFRESILQDIGSGASPASAAAARARGVLLERGLPSPMP